MLHAKLHMIPLIKETAVIGAMFLTGVVIDEKTLTNGGTVMAICGMVWWMGRKLQRIDDRLDWLDKRVGDLGCACEDPEGKDKEKHRRKLTMLDQ